MVRLKGWFDKARKLAADRLPPEVVDAGRKVRDHVVERAPAPIAEAIARVLPGDQVTDDDPTPIDDEPSAESPPIPEPVARREDVLERVRAKADKGLKPEDRLVVIYATADEAETVAEIRAQLQGVETTIREFDLAKDPQTRKQIAKLSGVMVPPYVFINGRHWGSLYDITALAESGDLELVVANRLDELGEEARRIGKVHETYSDEISVSNILSRWRAGHILCVDDLDAWYEVDRDGTERFFYQGGSRPPEDMPSVAEEITLAVEREEIEVAWLLDPAVQLR